MTQLGGVTAFHLADEERCERTTIAKTSRSTILIADCSQESDCFANTRRSAEATTAERRCAAHGAIKVGQRFGRRPCGERAGACRSERLNARAGRHHDSSSADCRRRRHRHALLPRRRAPQQRRLRSLRDK